jgi:hypothetical protein
MLHNMTESAANWHFQTCKHTNILCRETLFRKKTVVWKQTSDFVRLLNYTVITKMYVFFTLFVINLKRVSNETQDFAIKLIVKYIYKMIQIMPTVF